LHLVKYCDTVICIGGFRMAKKVTKPIKNSGNAMASSVASTPRIDAKDQCIDTITITSCPTEETPLIEETVDVIEEPILEPVVDEVAITKEEIPVVVIQPVLDQVTVFEVAKMANNYSPVWDGSIRSYMKYRGFPEKSDVENCKRFLIQWGASF
jgi:hypothetical protein